MRGDVFGSLVVTNFEWRHQAVGLASLLSLVLRPGPLVESRSRRSSNQISIAWSLLSDVSTYCTDILGEVPAAADKRRTEQAATEPEAIRLTENAS